MRDGVPARIDGRRLWNDLETLASYVDAGAPPFTRLVFGEAYARARDWLAGRMADAGLAVRRDSAGNLIGRLAGSDQRPPIVLGSHTDTVVGGGRFDGPLGVLGGLEVARALGESGAVLRHPLEIVDFVGEEPNAWGCSTVGSRAWAGSLDGALLELRGPGDEPLREALSRAGGDPGRVADARRRPGELAAYLELHIEQGPLLERAGLDVGIVSGIVGIERVGLALVGEARHAGTTPIAERADALAAAAEVVLAVERLAAAAAPDAVATVGRLLVAPNVTNVVPGRVELVIEARALAPGHAAALLAEIAAEARVACARRDVETALEPLPGIAPALADPAVVAALKTAAQHAGAGFVELASGAGHDASQLALVCPFGMLFAPCRGGISHHPDEWVEPAWAECAAQVLLAGVCELDVQLP